METTDPVEAIARAKTADPGNSFVAACEKFFAQRCYLSEKQLAALARVTPTRGRLDLAGGPLTWTGSDAPDEHGLTQSWDWAGGD